MGPMVCRREIGGCGGRRTGLLWEGGGGSARSSRRPVVARGRCGCPDSSFIRPGSGLPSFLNQPCSLRYTDRLRVIYDIYFSAARVPQENREPLVTQIKRRILSTRFKYGTQGRGLRRWRSQPVGLAEMQGMEAGGAATSVKLADPGPASRRGGETWRRASLRLRSE